MIYGGEAEVISVIDELWRSARCTDPLLGTFESVSCRASESSQTNMSTHRLQLLSLMRYSSFFILSPPAFSFST